MGKTGIGGAMMYVVDTNIISECMKDAACQNVIWWMQDHNEDVFLNAVTIYELYYGALHLPEGRRKRAYLEYIDAVVRECADRTLDFDAFSSYLAAKMRSAARAHGQQVTSEDSMIAAICARHDATLITHNVKDFDCYGIDVLDPFDYESETMKELRRREAERERAAARRSSKA